MTYYTENSDLPPNLAQQDLYPNGTYLGLTYRYYKGNVTYPFGYGLTYTNFTYSNLTVSAKTVSDPCQSVDVTVTVTNAGIQFTSDEVVQLYVEMWGSAGGLPAPNLRLAAFE